MNIDVTLIPALKDNYIFLLRLPQEQYVVVDPAVANGVVDALRDNDLAAILLTHHHHDHIDGVAELVQKYGYPVYGNGADSQLPPNTLPLAEGNIVPNLNATFTVMETPGHTAHHISYYSAENDMLFCGDVLFGGGCGRLFDGTAAQMFESLQRIKQLPPETKVYCAHEYTESNVLFGSTVKPENTAINQRLEDVRKLRRQGVSTVPLTLAEELATNIFLQAETLEDFTALRKAKDVF
ncbi:MAG: hydroxyacylglutathione hydrolase [Alphaproteobacteria bacterium]|nr:hydroxyacylglutathione hydrolase [Alphaproteobacteria bacterium]MDD9920560.1 hydroxyacylglutathione hydrolase [Alphaproteobacteria bacterium]